MKFKVGDRVTCDFNLMGEVLSVTENYYYNDILQPIQVIFKPENNKEHFTEEGIFHPGRETRYDIRHLTPLEELL